MKQNIYFKTYIGFSLFYLTLILLGFENIAWFLKPLLIPILILGVYFSNPFSTKKLTIIALVLSWLGDVLLLFEKVAEIYFILGLLSFLIAHISYTILFNKQPVTVSQKRPIIFGIGVSLITLYLITLLTLLYPFLKELKIPVIVYGIVISVMLFYTFRGYFKWQNPENRIILVGAIFFVTSDSILAIDKFYEPIENNSFWIMSTYILAQYLISIGIVNLNKKS